MEKFKQLDGVINELEGHVQNIGLVSDLKENIEQLKSSYHEFENKFKKDHEDLTNIIERYNTGLSDFDESIKNYLSSVNEFLEDHTTSIQKINQFMVEYHNIVENIIKSNLISSHSETQKYLARELDDIKIQIVNELNKVSELFQNDLKQLKTDVQTIQDKLELISESIKSGLETIHNEFNSGKLENQMFKNSVNKKFIFLFSITILSLISNIILIVLFNM